MIIFETMFALPHAATQRCNFLKLHILGNLESNTKLNIDRDNKI